MKKIALIDNQNSFSSLKQPILPLILVTSLDTHKQKKFENVKKGNIKFRYLYETIEYFWVDPLSFPQELFCFKCNEKLVLKSKAAHYTFETFHWMPMNQ
jgi:hypothetical protein